MHQINIVPNPSNGNFIINVSGVDAGIIMPAGIFKTEGPPVYEGQIVTGEIFHIKLSRGIYTITVTIHHKDYTDKIFIQ